MPIKTKGEHINSAFDKLRISGLTVNPTNRDNAQALSVLEDMAYEIEGRNMCINFAFEDVPDPATPSGVNPSMNNAIACNLAFRLLSNFGKNPQDHAVLSSQASQSMSNIASITARMPRYKMPNRMPVGSGNTFRFGVEWIRFYRDSTPRQDTCKTKNLEIEVSADYIVSWLNWLSVGETLVSYTYEATSGINVSGDQIQNNSTEIFFKAKGLVVGEQSVKFSVITTSSTPELADLKTIDFNIVESN